MKKIQSKGVLERIRNAASVYEVNQLIHETLKLPHAANSTRRRWNAAANTRIEDLRKKLTGLGIITHCPKCGSANLRNESSFLTEGTSCRDCGWADIDGGVDSGD